MRARGQRHGGVPRVDVLRARFEWHDWPDAFVVASDHGGHGAEGGKRERKRSARKRRGVHL